MSGDSKQRNFLRIFCHFFPLLSTFLKRSAQIKKLILKKLMGAPEDLGVGTFSEPISHFGFYRQCKVAGRLSERVAPAQLPLVFFFQLSRIRITALLLVTFDAYEHY